MAKAKKLLHLLFVPLLALSACKERLGPPKDYEIVEVANQRGGAYYEIFVRSFADTNNDGQGDLKGVTGKLSYLKELGIGGVWLMPIHPSPSYHGYDVEDYQAIHEDYGTLADFDEMIIEADAQNIDVIIDLVINHSSRTHPWFLEGYQNFKNGAFNPSDDSNKANWYNFYWQNGQVKYEAGFGDGMPDLNLDNPLVREEIENIASFWLERGVDGFRLDAVTYYYLNSPSKSVEFATWFQDMVREINPHAYIVGEAWKDQGTINSFYSGLDSLFNFPGSNSGGYLIDNITSRNGSTLAFQLAKTVQEAQQVNADALVATFLTNHDMDRSSQMFIMNLEQRQKLAASIYLLSPGVPFLYYGEEIGLKGTRGTAQTDANRRLPMQWQRNLDPWRTNIPEGTTYDMTKQVRDGAFDLLAEPFSLTNHYKKVLSIRNTYDWLTTARIEHVNLANNYIAGLKLTSQDGLKTIFVLHNVEQVAQELDLNRLKEASENFTIKHDIFTNQVRAKMNQNLLTLGAFSSVVIEEIK